MSQCRPIACTKVLCRDGATTATGSVDSVMAGLVCDETSPLAWRFLGNSVDAFILPDAVAHRMRARQAPVRVAWQTGPHERQVCLHSSWCGWGARFRVTTGHPSWGYATTASFSLRDRANQASVAWAAPFTVEVVVLDFAAMIRTPPKIPAHPKITNESEKPVECALA